MIGEFVTPWGSHIKANYREGTNDWNTLTSCITEDEYEIRTLIADSSEIDVDLGAHIGGVTLALASLGHFVHAIEMLPENIKLLKENIALNHFEDRVKVHEVAITGSLKEKVTAFYANTDTEMGKVHEFIGTVKATKAPGGAHPGGREIIVPTTTLEQLLKDIDVCNFMKVDIEGVEWDVFLNTPAAVLEKIKRIAIELEGIDEVVDSNQFLQLLPKGFIDASKVYFPKWSDPGTILHGYYININEK